MSNKYNIAVVGATGNVGREILQILEERNFPIDEIFCLASSRSKGKKLKLSNLPYMLLGITEIELRAYCFYWQ